MASIHRRKVYHRIRDVCRHLPRYWIDPVQRLSADTGISQSAIQRFLCGRSNPSYAHVITILQAFERQLGHPLDPREVLSMDGHYPTPSVCTLLGCKGCTSPEVYESDEFTSYFPGGTAFLTGKEDR